VKRRDFVILVTPDDRAIGSAEKMCAHMLGLLHRAVSVFVFDKEHRLLLQRRAAGKYHSPGRWSNTCCTHPWPGESTDGAAHRRLIEEMGLRCPLTEVFDFTYYASLDRGLAEHEVDHVFTGRFDGDPVPNADEVDGWRWESLDDICDDVAQRPERYSAWFAPALNALMAHDQRRSVSSSVASRTG
jgi:isopentenyl-diphosphate Delta-isomerase